MKGLGMKMKRRAATAVFTGAFAAAVFYVIFAVGCTFVPSDASFLGVVLRGFAEVCASFGGICALKLMRERFSPVGSESEISDGIEASAVERNVSGGDGRNIGSIAGSGNCDNAINHVNGRVKLTRFIYGPVTACVLFGANIIYSSYVYGNSEAPKLPLAVMILILGISVPFAEEIFFRGYLLRYFGEQNLTPTVSLLISSALFALIHDVRVMPFAFFAGLCLGICSLTGGRNGFIISFTAHGLYNTVLCIIAAAESAV